MRRFPREVSGVSRASSLASRLRPWALPTLTVFIAFWLFYGDNRFDIDDLRRDFRDGSPEAALARLQRAAPDELPGALAGMIWWPKELRARKLSDLAAVPEIELLEDAGQPTITAPLDKLLEAPDALRLREPLGEALQFQLRNTDMNLEVLAQELPAGSDGMALDATLLRGATYLATLAEPGGGPQRALAGFTWVAEPVAQRLVNSMTAAHDLAGDHHEGASLLSALVALHGGFTGEALRRLAPLRDSPGYERLATELSALALERQGLDLTARRLLER